MNLSPDDFIQLASQFQSMLTVIMKQNAEILALLKKTDADTEFKQATATYDAATNEFVKYFGGKK